jgi:transcriptional regulator with XRE-family HTH domain
MSSIIISPIKKEIGERLKSWGIKKYGSTKAFAEALQMSVENLSQYFIGKSLPGNKMQDRLREAECDLVWLMQGKTAEQINEDFSKSRIGRGLKYSDEQFRMLDYLCELDILTLKDLEDKLNWKMLYIEKEKTQLKMVAESPPPKYYTTKKRGEKK